MNRTPHLFLALSVVGLTALAIALATGAPPPTRAAGVTIKVPDDYPTIQAAIYAAADGDTILVAEGLYPENLVITEGLTLSGGWNISFTARYPGASVIDVQGLGRAISITCAASDTVVTIDGFTIRGGNATGLGGPPVALSKGDWFQGVTPSAAPTLDDRIPAGRAADLKTRLADLAARGLYPGGEAAYQAALARLDRLMAQAEAVAARSRPAATPDSAKQSGDCGGGIYSWNASLHLLNCTIQGNIASLADDGYGGGVWAGQSPPGGVRIIGNTLHDNIASASNTPMSQGVGGALYVRQAPGAVIADNVIRENAAHSGGVAGVGVGGGLLVESSLAPVVRSNRIVRNTAGAGWECLQGIAGGAYLRYVSGAAVTDNVFQDNVGVLYGGGGSGGLYLAVSQDVLVADNTATGNWGCVFQPNMTDVAGGGFSLHHVAAVTVTGNILRDNVAGVSGPQAGNSFGGGIDGQLWLGDVIVVSNTIAGNVACQAGVGWGGGVSLWTAEDSVVADNALTDNIGSLSGLGGGGGLFLRNTDSCSIYRNRFQGNQGAGEGAGSGGGLRVERNGPYTFDTTVNANLFLDNRACVANPTRPSAGGACVIVTDGFTFTNNVVAGNAADAGGGLALEFAPRGVVINNTLVGNGDAGVLVDQYNLTPITFTNNVIVSHTVGITVAAGATVTVRYTLWAGNGTDIAGAGAISHTYPVTGAPAFRDPAAHDYHLTVASAARDAGDPAGVPPAPAYDADGVARPQGPAVDIGTYEWRGYWLYLPLALKNWRTYIGWAVGDSADGYGTILHTTDSGETWVRQGNTQTIPNVNLSAVSAVDHANAWVVGENVILRTRDGGQTWEQQALPPDAPPDTQLYGVKAINGSTAWAVGYPDVLLQTTDGQTWSVTPRTADLYLASPVQYSDVDAADAAHVWAVGSFGPGARGEAVIAFYDGVQWRRQGAGVIPSDNSAALIGVSALDPHTAWAVGGFALPLVKTTDGGATWQMVGPALSPADTNRVVVVTANTGWVSGDFGSIQRTDDGGQTWAHQPTGAGAYLYTITAVDARLAWAVSPKDGGMDAGWLLRTLDGQNWEKQLAPVKAGLSGVSFVAARR